MQKLIWGFLFMCVCVQCYAEMVSGSRAVYAGNVTGRARANVVHSTSEMINVLTEKPQLAIVADTTEPEFVIVPVAAVAEPVAENLPDYELEIATATEYIAQLKAEIAHIDSEMARCRSAKTNWTIGTVVGSVGVVGTATGAIVQAIQINKAKKKGATESTTDSDKDTKESK